MLQVSPEDLGAALTSDVQYFKGVHCTSAPNQIKTYITTLTQGNLFTVLSELYESQILYIGVIWHLEMQSLLCEVFVEILLWSVLGCALASLAFCVVSFNRSSATRI